MYAPVVVPDLWNTSGAKATQEKPKEPAGISSETTPSPELDNRGSHHLASVF